MEALFALLQMSDSAFPIGTFTFSAGLESAVDGGQVTDEAQLSAFLSAALTQSAWTDGIAAMQAYHRAEADDYVRLLECDRVLYATKLNAELRTMSCKMGRKFTELMQQLYPNPMISTFWDDIRNGCTPGTYAVAHAIRSYESHLPEWAMFMAQQYGVASMILGAALRLLRVSHLQTQRLLTQLPRTLDANYEAVRTLSLDDMRTSTLQCDLVAAWHELGEGRLFMS